MSAVSGISRWWVALVISCVLIEVLASTRSTQAQDQGSLVLRPAFGLTRAIVVDVKDPEATGRIRIKFPTQRGDVVIWARVSLPLDGNETGFWSLPEIGDEVVVGFEQGDVSRPIVIGSLWNGKPVSPRCPCD